MTVGVSGLFEVGTGKLPGAILVTVDPLDKLKLFVLKQFWMQNRCPLLLKLLQVRC